MQIESPEGLSASGSGIINSNRIILADKVREKVLPFLLALSVLINLAAIFTIRDTGTEQRLKQYNLDWFKAHEFSDLKSEVAVQSQLLKLTCKEK